LQKGGEAKDFDIWNVRKSNGKWSEPQNLGAPVNTNINEFYPSVTSNGDIYYTAAYKSAKGKEDIFMSRFENGKYADPVSLDSVNTPLYEFNAFVAPDASYIIFTSFGRNDDTGGGDLYISRKNGNGNWGSAKNLGPKINSPALDYCPAVSPDQSFFVFTSDRTAIRKTYRQPLTLEQFVQELSRQQNGKGNLYWIDAKEILK
jgi:hypothetical protein